MTTSKVKLTMSDIHSKTSRHVKKQENLTKTGKKHEQFKTDSALIELPELGHVDVTSY